MASINNMKKDNASILLADGTSIGAGQSGIKYRDLSGAIGSMMKAVVRYIYSFLVSTHGFFLSNLLLLVAI